MQCARAQSLTILDQKDEEIERKRTRISIHQKKRGDEVSDERHGNNEEKTTE
jgi:hypothetical protein